MTFATPLVLLTLLSIPVLLLLAFAVSRRRAKYPLAFTNLELLAQVAPQRHRSVKRFIPLALLDAVSLAQ